MRPNWSEIIVHHSAGADTPGLDTEAIRRWHVEGRHWRDIGYHFLCERVGQSYQVIAGRPLDMEGAHCPGHNQTAIGFCFVGDFSVSPPPIEQLALATDYITGLCSALLIEAVHIYPHRDFRATDCPGSVPVEAIKNAVATRIGRTPFDVTI